MNTEEHTEELRRIIARTMFPSNPDMGGREYYRLDITSQRKIDNCISQLNNFEIYVRNQN
jgi:hypothetical protein